MRGPQHLAQTSTQWGFREVGVEWPGGLQEGPLGQQIHCPIPDVEGLSEGSPAGERAGEWDFSQRKTQRTQEKGESKTNAVFLEELWTESQRA